MITTDAYAQYPETFTLNPQTPEHCAVIRKVAVTGLVFVVLMFAAALGLTVISSTTPAPIQPTPLRSDLGPAVVVSQTFTPTSR